MKLPPFQEYLKQQKIDLAFFIHPDPFVTYFSQKNFSFALLLITPIQATIYLTKLDAFPSLKNMTPKLLPKNWEKDLSSEKTKKISINKESMTLAQQERLKKMFPNAVFVDSSYEINQLREVKTPEEMRKIIKACAITSHAFFSLLKELPKKTIKTELDVSFFLESFIRRQGAELAFPSIVASGKNSATPHHNTSLQKLAKGFLQLDFGARWENYCSDMSRVIYLGNPSKEEIEKYNFLLSVQEACIAVVREGGPFKDLHTFAQEKLGKLSPYFTHGLGHGVGIEVHEAPLFKSSEAKIQRFIPFTIEPGVYFPEKYGLRIEDTLYWDGEKAEVLTKATKQLQVVGW